MRGRCSGGQDVGEIGLQPFERLVGIAVVDEDAASGAGSRVARSGGEEEPLMGREREEQVKDRDLPSGDPEIERVAEENRREMDEVPPHGTDPLHEGP